MLKKVLFSISLVFVVSAFQNLPQADIQLVNTLAQVGSEEVAPCTNGFDDVNVCQLRS